MSLRCGGMCNNHFVANLVLSLNEVIDTSRVSCVFDSQCRSGTNIPNI